MAQSASKEGLTAPKKSGRSSKTMSKPKKITGRKSKRSRK